MRKTTKFGEAPWAAVRQDRREGQQTAGRRQAGVMNRRVQRTGGRRGS